MKEKSWGCTFITQLTLCISAYIALNIGQPQKHSHANNLNKGRPIDMFFISVAGGFRPVEGQTLLLKQIANVVKTYKAHFVIDISEFGESDALVQNATLFPELQSVPWYTTRGLHEQGKNYFLKKIKIPNGQTLDIIAVDTVLFQDPLSVPGNDHWSRTLKQSYGDWRIVVGIHKSASCDYNILKLEEETAYKHLRKKLIHYGADAYISRQDCTGHVLQNKSPFLTIMNRSSVSKRETADGFLLHQITSLGMDTFFVKLTGEIEYEVASH